MTHAWGKSLLGRRCGTWKEILSVGEGWTSLPNSERAKRTRFLFCIFCMHGMYGIYVYVYVSRYDICTYVCIPREPGKTWQ